MFIAPRVTTDDWKSLNLDDHNSKDWERAVSIFEARIVERYFNPVDILLKDDEKRQATERRFGFTILAIDCLLIETLQAFIDGKKDTNGKSADMFRRFLTQRSGFKGQFDENLSNSFYKYYRCGILHQAEITGKSKVWSVGKLVDVRKNGEMIINRTKFHLLLRQEFDKYLNELRDPGKIRLRANFRKKMDYICQLRD
jgi:hypothetical protein